MIEYPSIPSSAGQSFREFDAHVFGKLDGRNTRWEWSRKRGWYKFGTRTRGFDASDPEYGPAIPLFRETLAGAIERVAAECGWDRLVAFAEYWGDESLGGTLVPGDEMHVSLIDVAAGGRLLPPGDFVRLFVRGGAQTAPYLGRQRWTRGFVARVRDGQVEGATLEGVVGKGSRGEMAKAKTAAWVEAVRSRFAPGEAERIVNS